MDYLSGFQDKLDEEEGGRKFWDFMLTMYITAVVAEIYYMYHQYIDPFFLYLKKY